MFVMKKKLLIFSQISVNVESDHEKESKIPQRRSALLYSVIKVYRQSEGLLPAGSQRLINTFAGNGLKRSCCHLQQLH